MVKIVDTPSDQLSEISSLYLMADYGDI